MTSNALYIRHTAKPGKRDEVMRIWDKYVRAYVETGNDQISYYYCFDDTDPNSIVVFQTHENPQAAAEFEKQPWYKDYVAETGALLAGPSEFRPASSQWVKHKAA